MHYNYHANLRHHFEQYTDYLTIPRSGRFCVQFVFPDGKKFSLRPDNVGEYLKYWRNENVYS